MARSEIRTWAENLVAGAKLGDKRRNARVTELMVAIMNEPGASISAAARGNEAAREKYYRHARAQAVSSDELLKAACEATAADVVLDGGPGDILLIGDTTSLSYKHSVASKLGVTGSDKNAKSRGWLVHTVLAVSAESGEVLGPVEQLWWTRDNASHGKSHLCQERDYEEKESLKWEASATKAVERLAAVQERTVLITDRESDVYEYLVHLVGEGRRYIVRSCWNRRLTVETARVFEHCEAQPVLAKLQLVIPQKGNRRARRAQLVMRTGTVTLRPPNNVESRQPQLEVNVVLLTEINAPEGIEPVRWVLLTSEPVSLVDQATKVVVYYSRRWRIEEFHKFWKSDGMKVEDLRMTTPDNLRRVAVPMAFAACRLMRLRDSVVPCLSNLEQILTPEGQAESASLSSAPLPITTASSQKSTLSGACTQILTTEQWRVLWVVIEKTHPPNEVPQRIWAARAIAKLGGFGDTKRTGRPGYRTFLQGWRKLLDYCDILPNVSLLGGRT